MIAKFCDGLYEIIKNESVYELITYKKEKKSEEFTSHRNFFYAPVSIDDDRLSDIFIVEFFGIYDTGLDDVPIKWKLGQNEVQFENSTVLLRYTKGYLPNWKVEEKGISVKQILIDDIATFFVKYQYLKKDGQLCDGIVEESELAKDEFISLCKMFLRSNL